MCRKINSRACGRKLIYHTVQKTCRLNGFQTAWLLYSGLTKIRTRRRSRRQYK
ncbi:hypothetical protein M5099_07280 [Neisseria meningitidis]|uniref:glycosyl transferase family 1 n=1 Tax=Neisseria meningitidis TaxID=487 RepID=UPI000FCA9EA2|nr:glycosyl transferase family 1 [Neisseria meningitidis]MBW3934180.1 hypothetical protein [Neisseria meningitidis]MCL4995784.1 hypothetical protein [Neisseria meningitidis]MCL5898630.1 hypothetical protein [Neisseria meningitidis]